MVSNENLMNGPDQKLAVAQPSQLKPLPVRFIHKESKSFHTVPADGVWGMVNGQGNIQIIFLTEHPPIPDAVIFPVNQDGGFVGQMTEEYKENDPNHYIVIREFQVGVTMSITAAKQAHIVLGNFIAMVEDQLRLAQQANAKTTKTQ